LPSWDSMKDIVSILSEHEWLAVILQMGVLVCVYDILTTVALVPKSGFYEANPIMDYVLQSLGVSGLVIVNSILTVVILVFLILAPFKLAKPSDGNFRYAPMLVLVIIRGSAVVNNFTLLMLYYA